MRDEANRISLAADKVQLHGQLVGLEAHEPPATVSGRGRFGTGQVANPAWQQWHDQATAVEGKLAGIASAESGLELGGRGGGQRGYLLGFDTNDNGHAIVSFGDPGAANNTVTYVPGLGSKLTGAFGDSSRAAALAKAVSNLAPDKAVASIYWLGYNAPQLPLSQGIHHPASEPAVGSGRHRRGARVLAPWGSAERQRHHRRAGPAAGTRNPRTAHNR